ncbi:alpha/beta hydrolase [Streptomyces sp. 4N509B]|uniref:alpha/beta hydrolase n=1 Tax=Streptomyces sp. 4N509B TaxID=3457413 RepID=UPI003FD4661F
MRRRTAAAMAPPTPLLVTGVATAAASRWARTRQPGGRPPPPRPAGFAAARVTVHATAAGRVTLSRTLDSLRPGTFGIGSATVHAVVGPVLDLPTEPDTVVRRLERVSHGTLLPGATLALTPQLYDGDPRTALGIDHTEVEITDEHGALPAWLVPGARDTWVIALHGLGATREHALNLVPFLHRQRVPVLLPAHPGEDAAPRARRRGPFRSASGATGATGRHEVWRDADAALRYAVRHGARRVVLHGWSAGGVTALRTAVDSPLRGRVSGVVLDSPVLNPVATARALAAERGVPRPLALLARRAPGAPRLPDPPGDLTTGVPGPTPVLVFHGPGDTVAPFDASRALAARYPERVVLHTVGHAQHAAMWNADPRAYEETLRRFLTPLM